MDHEAEHTDQAALGPPFVRFFLQGPDGGRAEVALWAPPVTPWELSTFRGWMFIQGHATFDPPRRVFGEGPWQPVWIMLEYIDRYTNEHGLTLVQTP